MDLTSQKHLFTLDSNIHYLNCAYKAPLLKTAETAAIDELISLRTPSSLKPDDFFNDAEEVRALFAEIVGSASQNIAIIPSTTYGFSSVLNNIKGKKDGHAITVVDEFPSGYFSLKRWCEENENALRVVGPNEEADSRGQSWNENLLAAIDHQTSIVLISSVHWTNGTVFDLEAIGGKCKEVGATFVVDGTQSVGVMEMDVNKFNIDALVCASYKWLFGPYSIALAHIGESFSQGRPLEESWMNRLNARKFSELTDYEETYSPGAGRYNVGQNSNLILMPMLKISLQQLLEWEPKRIEAYCNELIKPLLTYLTECGVELESKKYFSSHLFSLRLPSAFNTDRLQEIFETKKIVVSLRGADIRVSLNVFNDENDIHQLIEAIHLSRSIS